MRAEGGGGGRDKVRGDGEEAKKIFFQAYFTQKKSFFLCCQPLDRPTTVHPDVADAVSLVAATIVLARGVAAVAFGVPPGFCSRGRPSTHPPQDMSIYMNIYGHIHHPRQGEGAQEVWGGERGVSIATN